MCGIAGIIGASETQPLSEVLSKMAHRGPDSSGYYCDDESGICLLHTRLAILDLTESANQPMVSGDNRITMVYNGEIYNYKELRTILESLGYNFLGSSDTEVIIKAYAHFGVDFLQKIKGMFAIAIWDKIANRCLVARDPSGIKPLYYKIDGQELRFASELKALLPMLNTDIQIDSVALSRYLSFLWCPGDETPVSGVKKLGPGEQIVWAPNKPPEISKWYNQFTVKSSKNPSFDKSRATLITELRRSVHEQLQADVPIGGLLSGGLDSSSLMVFAREMAPSISCYTAEFDGQKGGEFSEDLDFADKVAKHLKLDLNKTLITSEAYAENFESLVYQLDEPIADPAAFNLLMLANHARKDGVKVLLSGIGGDELFSGYRRHSVAKFLKFQRYVPRLIWTSIETLTEQNNNGVTYLRRLNRLAKILSSSEDEKSLALFLWVNKSQVVRLFSQKFRDLIFKTDTFLPMREVMSCMGAGCSDLDKVLAIDRRHFLADHNLNYSDKVSMSAGVELRVPFLDEKIVHFVKSLPNAYTQTCFHDKWILRKAMEPYLPKDAIYRKKIGFGAPLSSWMRLEMRELLNKYLCPLNLKRRGLFDPNEVSKVIKEHVEGTFDHAYLLLSLLTIEIWCQHFLDNKSG